MSLRVNSTPLDFAYAVTEVGNPVLVRALMAP